MVAAGRASHDRLEAWPHDLISTSGRAVFKPIRSPNGTIDQNRPGAFPARGASSFLPVIGCELAGSSAPFSLPLSLSLCLRRFPPSPPPIKLAANHRKSGGYANPDFLWSHGCCGNAAHLPTTSTPPNPLDCCTNTTGAGSVGCGGAWAGAGCLPVGPVLCVRRLPVLKQVEVRE